MKKLGKAKAAGNKAAEKMINSVLDELKSDPLEESQRVDLFDVDSSSSSSSSSDLSGKETENQPAVKMGFADIAMSSPNEDQSTGRIAPEGLSDDLVRQITKTSTRKERLVSVKATSSNEATIVSGSDDTGITQPASTSPYGGQKKQDDDATSTNSTNASISFADKTQPMYRPYSPANSESLVKVSHGAAKLTQRPAMTGGGGGPELQLLQAENLKLAQTRIMELEKEVEKLRQENELLFAAGELGKRQNDEFAEKLGHLERERNEVRQQSEMELSIFRDSLQERERDLKKSKARVQELEARLATDLKKIRVRERELENRLELSRMEKTTLLRAKDDTLLDLKRKIDFLNSELDQYKQKSAELAQKLDQGQDQMARTVRALRLALTNLEANGETASTALTIIKKAE